MPQLIEYRPHVLSPARPSFLERVRAAVRSFTIAPIPTRDPALAKLFGVGYETAAGITVNHTTAFTFSAVLSAVTQLSSDVAKLPLILKKRRDDGGSDDYLDSKTYRLLKDEPNPDMSSYTWRQTMMAHALTCKGAFSEIERDGSGRPAAFWPLTPDRVEPKLEQQKLANGRIRTRLRYRIDGDDQRMIEAGDILHIHGLGYDGYVGYDTINLSRQAIGMALAAEKFGASVFKTGRFGGILTTEDFLDPTSEQAQEIASKVQQYKQGFEQFLLLFGAKWKYDKTGIGPQDAQMEATRDQQVEEVARFFNMPLHKLKLNKPGAVSYASVEMADLDYYKGPILDWITAWEQELNRKLVSPLEYRRQYVKHNANAFLRGDIKSRYDALGIALDKGVINADEWRELEDWNPQPDGQGKLYLVQGAMVPKNKIEAINDAKIEKDKAKSQPPPAPAPAPQPTEDPERKQYVDALVTQLEAAKAAERAALDELTDRDVRLKTALKDVDELQARERTAIGDVGVLSGRLIEIKAELESARAKEDEADSAVRAAQVSLAEMSAKADEARKIAESVIEEARGQNLIFLESFKAESAKQREADAERVSRMQQALDAADLAYREAVEQTQQLERQKDALQRRVNELTTDVEAARKAVEQAEARVQIEVSNVAAVREELAAAGQIEADGLAVQIQAHRDLIVSIMRRMVERETDKGRQAQGTPEKRRKWLETFYEAHADLMRKSLLPAVRIHLAFIRSSDDPIKTTRRLVDDHIQRSELELRQVLDGDADAASMQALFYRWDQERPTQIADRLMAKELEYARRC